MTTHSKLPWSVRCENEWDDFGIRYAYPVGIVDADNNTVLMFDDDYENLSANAKLIVDAVNGHTAAAIQRERDRAADRFAHFAKEANELASMMGRERDVEEVGTFADELQNESDRIRRGEA